MDTIIAKPGQTMSDIIISAFGTMEGSMEFLLANNVSITDIPFVGQGYRIPEGQIYDKEVLQYMKKNGITTGTK